MVIDYFKKEKKPLKGLLAVEWVVMIYLVVTLAATLIWYDTMTNPHALISGRIEVLFTTLLLWGVYRMYPSKAMRFIRIGVQMALLSWWYPDTYELNRQLPNLDHIFAGWEQSVFGCQPALLFSQHITSPVFSELMDLGYASYYPLIAIVSLYYLFRRNNEFERCVFIIMASFFTYYVIFDLVPVVGPTFYYKAVGGERPTAAFPSSHVGVTTVLMWLAWHTKNHRLVYIMLPFFILMFFATVYIQAHYAIDAFAGLVSGTLFYFFYYYLSKYIKV